MRTLIVGAGALGGVIATRLLASGADVSIAARNDESATALKTAGLQVTGVGGPAAARPANVAPLDAYPSRAAFDLVVLATKAHDAIDAAPRLLDRLAPDGVLLPVQNGAVAQAIASLVGRDRLVAGLSNLGATMTQPGRYEQRNAGHLLIGELAGGRSERVERVRAWLGRALDVRITANIAGAVWSKLLLNCSVTTIGAIAGLTMRQYVALAPGLELFERTYDESLSVALAAGTRLEPMAVNPVPPAWTGRSIRTPAQDAWIADLVKVYGDAKASMLQDFERGRRTEIDFINGYVIDVARPIAIPTPVNAAIVGTVQAITRGTLTPSPVLLERVLAAC